VKRLLAQLRLVFDAPPDPPAPPDGRARVSPVAPRLVRHPRARQYVLRVLSDGTPRVTIPRWGSKREALAFLEAQRDWVARQRARRRRVTLRRGSARRAGVVAAEDVLLVTPRPRDAENLRPVATAWLLVRAKQELPPRLLALAARFDLAVTQVSVRNQRARWGSCATGGRISLNWRLVQTPDAVRDYVLIHELMHLRQPNHSARFWALVARACPDHEVSRRWLRAHEAALLDAR
jgi:predicted metal-dependent hydrolase